MMAKYHTNRVIAAGMLLALAGCAAPQASIPDLRLSAQSEQQATPGSRLQRGRAQLSAGLDSMAIESFRSELRANPDSAEAYNGLAVAYGRIGRGDLAQRYFEMALARAPDDLRYQNNLVRLSERTGKRQFTANLPEPLPDLPAMPAIAQVLDALPDDDGPVPENVFVTAQPVQAKLPERPFLSRTGILSTQLAALPVRSSLHVKAIIRGTVPLPKAPDPAHPYPEMPLVDLPRELRGSGAHLERVSLGEVRLVTLDPTPASQPGNRQFASFGDRLSDWLPQAIASEHAGQMKRLGDKPAMLAAIERAEVDLAMAASILPEPMEFAYIIFPETDLGGA